MSGTVSAEDARIAALRDAHAGVAVKLDTLKLQLGASIDKAAGDPGHAGYAEAFVRDVDLKADEILAWIARHV